MSFKKSSYGRSVYTFVLTLGSYFYRSKVKNITDMTIEDADKHLLNVMKKELSTYIESVNFYQNPNYKESLEAKKIDDFLQNIPVIDKDNLKDKNHIFFNENWGVGKNKHTTSGSSGSPLTIYSSVSERLYSEAMLCLEIEKETKTWGLRNCMILSGFYVNENHNVDNFYTYDPIFNNIYVSIYHFNKENSQKYMDLINKFKPSMIYGYASAIRTLSQIIGESNFNKKSIKIIVSTSEILYEDWRNEIEMVFDAKVHNLYGSQEGCHFSFECAYGNMHINPARGIIEVKNKDGVFRTGKGEAIVSAINRKSFPLYRYNLKDTIEIKKPKEKCKCGLHTYLISEVEGRSEDLVRLQDGRKIGYLNFHSTKDLFGILESQLIQKNWSTFNFIYVIDPAINEKTSLELERKISDEIKKRIGHDIDIYFNRVNEIPRNSRGKFKAVVVEDF